QSPVSVSVVGGPRPCGSDTLSLHDALPIASAAGACCNPRAGEGAAMVRPANAASRIRDLPQRMLRRFMDSSSKSGSAEGWIRRRSEEHTSELQSRENLVCRLLLDKKK